MAANDCNAFVFLPFCSVTSYTTQSRQHTVKLGYNVMKGTEYFVSTKMRFFLIEWYNITFNSEELTGHTEYPMLEPRYCINQYCYSQVLLQFVLY